MAGSLPSHSLLTAEEIALCPQLKIGIVYTFWNESIIQKLLHGALKSLKEAGVSDQHIFSLQVPGAFELPLAAHWLMTQHTLDAVIGLGCIIKGETDHDVYIAQSVSMAFQNLSLQYAKPFIFGVLTVLNEQQAEDRAGGRFGNKGEEAAVAAIKMHSLRSNQFPTNQPVSS